MATVAVIWGQLRFELLNDEKEVRTMADSFKERSVPLRDGGDTHPHPHGDGTGVTITTQLPGGVRIHDTFDNEGNFQRSNY